MHLIKKVPGQLIGLVISLCFGLAMPVFAAHSTVAIGIDTVAGEGTLLRSANFQSEESVVFHIQSPESQVISLTAKSNSAGEAKVILDGLNTRISGKYYLFADSADGSFKTPTTAFFVHPAGMDDSASEIDISRTVVKADGLDMAKITVRMADKFGNPLSKMAVRLLASDNDVQIEPNIDVTDSDGFAIFSVRSSNALVTTLMALDTGNDVLLKERGKVSFVAVDEYLTDAGGNLINHAYAADFGVLDHFEIDGIPATIDRNDNVSFTVKAVDADGAVVEDYTGTIRFSVEGSNSSAVTLPDNYKYLATDLGQHKFSLGLNFAEDGTYKVLVSDLSDKFKQGDQTVVVGSAGSGSSGDASEVKPTISAPAAGTYSQAEQTISGTAKGSSTISIYDNDKISGTVPVGPTGKYSYQSDAMKDGEHTIYVVNQDSITLEVLGTSDRIVINIDTTPPKLEEMVLEPMTGIKPGDVIDVQVFSEKGLSQAALIFNYDIVELNASIDDDTLYVGTVQAPQEPGIYKMSVLLVDELQNEVTLEDQASITVSEEGGAAETDVPNDNPPVDSNLGEDPVDVNTENTDEATAGLPTNVSGLIAYGSDKRVTLVWDAATDDTMVKKYKIYYGDKVTDLTQVLETKDASTTWYVPNLENGKEYFFAVSAMDDQGNVSAAKSEIVSAIPFVLEIRNALTELPKQSIAASTLHEAAYSGPYPSQTTGTGPEVLLLALGSLAGGVLFSKRKK